MPELDPDALGEYMIVRGARKLEDYLERFGITLSVLQTAEALERVAYELAEDAAREGVRYIEVRYAPILNLQQGLTLEEAVEAPLRGLERAERGNDVVARLIICGLRNLTPASSLELAALAVTYKDRGVVGFDLAGGEAGNPASAHADAFRYAHDHDLACTCHAGEGDGAASVREAVHACCAQRVGHGTRMIDDDSLTEYVNDRRIAVEICLTSNVQTHAAESYETHPMRAYFDRGLNVVLNTDNRLMSGVSLTDEYVHAVQSLDFSFDELAQVALNGFESCFLPYDERMRLVSRAQSEIATLRKAVA